MFVLADLLSATLPPEMAEGHPLLAAACSNAMALMYHLEGPSASAAPAGSAADLGASAGDATAVSTGVADVPAQCTGRGHMHTPSEQQPHMAAVDSFSKVATYALPLLSVACCMTS